MFLKNKNIIFKTRRSKVTDYAALMLLPKNSVPFEGLYSSSFTVCSGDIKKKKSSEND